jgi:sugar/nucleoside kinase (ribokinase family)
MISTATELNSPARRVVIIGNLTIDDVVRADGTVRMARPGGNAVYAAMAARLWAPAVGIVARRGEDLPEEMLTTLGDLGVNTSAVRAVDGPTVRNWVIYEDDGRRRFLPRTDYARAFEVAVQPADIPDDWLLGDPTIHVAAMPLAVASAVVDHIREKASGAVISLDTHEDWSGHAEWVIELARRVDIFIPSREELADLVGYDDPPRACRTLREAGVPAVVVKLGADGALVDTGEGPALAIGAYPSKVADATGAGDTFCGALAASLASGHPLHEAVRRGAATAAWAIEAFGSLSLAALSPEVAREQFDALEGGTPTDALAVRDDIDVMALEIAMIPEVIATHVADPGGHVRRTARLLVERGIEHLFLVGCGDSYFAGLATALVFQRHTGIHARAVHALDFARYQARYTPPRSAVVCVSFSGKVGRTIEAAVQAARFGALAIALTNDESGSLARAADHVLPIDVPTLGFSPGTSTYLGMVATLCDLALRWAAERGLDINTARAELDAIPELAARTSTAAAGPCEKAALLLAGEPWITFLGGGPNEGSAKFGAAKLFEGAQLLGVSTNIEEWAHEEYFVSSAGTPVVLVAPSGASRDRADEILAELDFIAARAIVVSDVSPSAAEVHIPLAQGVSEEFSPLLAALPLSLLGFHLAEALGKRSYNFPSEAAKAEHYDTIHRLVIGEPA